MPSVCFTGRPNTGVSMAKKSNQFEAMGQELGALVDEKQKAYGDSVGKADKIIRILYPGGIGPADISGVLLVVRILDKLSRIATDRDALGEEPWKDIAGYGLLGMKMVADEK